MRLRDLLGGLSVPEWDGDPSVEVTAVTHDSRRVVPGALFCCVPGATVDGHDYAAAAVAAGARSLLVERFVEPEFDSGIDSGVHVAQARVASVRAAMGPVASRFYGDPSRSLRCLGVTGTNGKTTTTYLLESIIDAAGERAGVIGTIGARVDGVQVPGPHTTPEAPDLQALLARMRDAGVQTVAMEVSSHALTQHRVDGTHFAAACFTNLTHDHLDFHGSTDAYFEAKARLFTAERIAAAAGNLDDPFGAEILDRCRRQALPTVSFGFARSARLTALDVSYDIEGSRFVLCDREEGQQAPIALTLLGEFNVANALAAAATALAGGFEFDDVVEGLHRPLVVPGRLERVDAGQGFTVLVDYAHTPDALARALDAARSLAPAGRVLAVFGCGGDRDIEKRPLMGASAASGADFVVITSDNPRSEDPESITDAIVSGWRGGTRFVVDLDRRSAIRRALSDAEPDDVVLVAGKGHEAGQTADGITIPFDDRVVVRDELEALGCG